MAMLQRDDPPSRCALRRTSTIEAIKRLEPPSQVRYGASGACGRLRALRVRRWRISPPKRSFCGASLEYAVMHDDEEEAERIREEQCKLTESV
jgi:hypothetical protein